MADIVRISPLMTKDQLAEHWGCSPRWIELRVKNSGLPHRKLGRSIRFRLEEVEGWLEGQQGAT